MADSSTKKEYPYGNLTIVWEPGKCRHAGNCVRNSPQVFRPRERPWINPEGSTADNIKNAINSCPSGALSYYYKH